MEFLDEEIDLDVVLTADRMERWAIYYRLRELAIACQCRPKCPLRVKIQSELDLVQVWSVTRQFTAAHHEHVEWLETCWNQSV